MNNIITINKLLNTYDIKQKYDCIYRYITNLTNSTLFLFNTIYNKNILINILNDIKYLIFIKLNINGGLGDAILLLKSDSNISDIKQDYIYDKLFNIVITNKDINYPLCNCCLNEFTPQNSNWYTSSITHQEKYINNGNEYFSHSSMHICYSCNILLKLKLKKYYDSFKLVPFNEDVFKDQCSKFTKYQSLCFNLLLNFDIQTLKKILI
jgi:hypothetical protein